MLRLGFFSALLVGAAAALIHCAPPGDPSAGSGAAADQLTDEAPGTYCDGAERLEAVEISGRIAGDSETLYWIRVSSGYWGSELVASSVGGSGAPSPPRVITHLRDYEATIQGMDADWLYLIVDQDVVRVARKADADGGNALETLKHLGFVASARLDGDNLYVVYGNPNGVLGVMPKSGGPIQVLQQHLNQPNAVAMVGNYTYVADFDRWYTYPRQQPAAPVAGDIVSPLPVDESGVYGFGKKRVGISLVGPSTIKRWEAGVTGTLTILYSATGYYDVGSVFLAPADIYFTEYETWTLGSGTVQRVPKAGGPAKVLVQGLRAPRRAQVFGDYLYFVESPRVFSSEAEAPGLFRVRLSDAEASPVVCRRVAPPPPPDAGAPPVDAAPPPADAAPPVDAAPPSVTADAATPSPPPSPPPDAGGTAHPAPPKDDDPDDDGPQVPPSNKPQARTPSTSPTPATTNTSSARETSEPDTGCSASPASRAPAGFAPIGLAAALGAALLRRRRRSSR